MSKPNPQQQINAAACEELGFFAEIMFPLASPGETFQPNWHIDAINEHLRAVYDGDIHRLLVCMPPRSMKSYLISVAFPLWVMGRDPHTKFIAASYNQTLADTFSRQTRQLSQHERYQQIFPKLTLDRSKISAQEISTTAKGSRFATSVGGTLTGRGCDYLIADDLLKAEDGDSEVERNSARDWFNGTAMTRFNDPKKGRAIVVAQRLHHDDVPGMLIETGGWTVLELPMIEWTPRTVTYGTTSIVRSPGELLHPDRITTRELNLLRQQLGERMFEAQYNQRPLPPGGATFKGSWLRYYDEDYALRSFDWIVQSWDTAQGTSDANDYSALTVWGRRRGRIHLIFAGRKRLAFNDLEKAIISQRQRWIADLVLLERQGAGFSLLQNIVRDQPNYWLHGMSPKKAKLDRALRHTPKFERGEILFPAKATWLDRYREELLSFPHGRHDDWVDSTTQFLDALDTGKIDLHVDLARAYAA